MTSVLHDEIFEQPAVVRQFIATQAAPIAAIGRELVGRNLRYVVIAARGSSDNAARYAQYLFGACCRLTVALAAPALYGPYSSPTRLDGALVIGVSQSGQSPDIVRVLEEARQQGAPTVAITNDPRSPLAVAADHCIELGAGAERSIAATKTYTAQLTAVTLLALSMAPDGVPTATLDRLPATMSAALAAEEQARAAAGRLAPANRCVVLGRGFNYATACEIALKIKELTYIVAEPYSTADFQHGPIAIVEQDFPVVLVAVGETMRGELLGLRDRLRERGASLIVLCDDPAARHPDDIWIDVPGDLPEWLSPCVVVVPGQLLAYHLAFARGLDPDQPRAIRKVTLTR